MEAASPPDPSSEAVPSLDSEPPRYNTESHDSSYLTEFQSLTVYFRSYPIVFIRPMPQISVFLLIIPSIVQQVAQMFEFVQTCSNIYRKRKYYSNSANFSDPARYQGSCHQLLLKIMQEYPKMVIRLVAQCRENFLRWR